MVWKMGGMDSGRKRVRAGGTRSQSRGRMEGRVKSLRRREEGRGGVRKDPPHDVC